MLSYSYLGALSRTFKRKVRLDEKFGMSRNRSSNIVQGIITIIVIKFMQSNTSKIILTIISTTLVPSGSVRNGVILYELRKSNLQLPQFAVLNPSSIRSHAPYGACRSQQKISTEMLGFYFDFTLPIMRFKLI